VTTMANDPIRKAVRQLSRLPGIGEKSATRLVYWMLTQPGDVPAQLAAALSELGDSITECRVCCTLTTKEDDPCSLCRRGDRHDGLILVVEHPQDVLAFERTGEFKGRYHVLHGALSPLDGITPDQLRIRPLLERLRTEEVQEVVLATDPNVEGDATALYLARLLKPIGVRTTRLAHGISVGTEIEYADSVSLARAFEFRREL
jgi:recombination protein RecR